MTSWFGTGNDTAGRLKAFIKDHLGVSESASFDSQASVDAEVHPFDVDAGSRPGIGGRQDTVIQVDVRPKAPPPRPPKPPPIQRPPQPPVSQTAISLPTRDSRTYDFRKTDTQFNIKHHRAPDYTQPHQDPYQELRRSPQPNEDSYQEYKRDPQDPQLSPPLKAISRRLEKQTTWDRGKDYLASMSDSDSDQSLSSHDTGGARPRQSSSAESRAYFKTFNTEKFNEQHQKTIKVSVAKTNQITVSRKDRPTHHGGDTYRLSSQARPLVIPDRTDHDDGYGSVENSSSGTASSDSSSPSNTPEQVSPGGDAVAVARRREAFRRSTKKKATVSVQDKLRKLCAVSGSTSVKECDSQEAQKAASLPMETDIERCLKCRKQKGVPHLLHMYDAESICLCDNATSQQHEESRHHNVSSDAPLSSNTQSSAPFSSANEGNISVKGVLPPLPNRTKLQGPPQENLSTARVNFRFASSNPGNPPPSVPLKADHGIAVPSTYDKQITSEMHSLDSRHRDWLVEQNTQLSHGSALPNRQDYPSPYHQIDQPLFQQSHQYQIEQYDGPRPGVSNAAGAYQPPLKKNEIECESSSADQFNSESSRKIFSSQRSKYTSDYARFMLLLEKTKNKVVAEESQFQGQKAGSPGQWSGSPGQYSGSSSVQFMKSSEIYQRLKELKVGGKSSLRRSVSAPQSPVKKKHHLRGAWSEDYAILVRAPLPPSPARSPAPRDIFQELMSRPTLQLATDF